MIVTRQMFNELLKSSENRKLMLRVQKGEEYTRGDEDVLANFRCIGKQIEGIKLTPNNAAMVVWFVYFHKHLDALVNYIKVGKERSNEPITGRVDDMQVYLDLFRGFIQSNQVEQAAEENDAERAETSGKQKKT